MALTFGQDLDAMIEARNAAEWEEINEEPVLDREEVCERLNGALDSLKDVFIEIGGALSETGGFSVHSQVSSIWNDLELVQDDLTSLIARIKEVKSA